MLNRKEDLSEFLDDSFEIGYAEYAVRITYSDAYDGDVDVMSCEVEIGAGVYAKVDEDGLDKLKPELIKRLKRNFIDDFSNVEAA